jgi:hypothetical protein
VIARAMREISRRSRDRANPLWKPSSLIATFRVAEHFCQAIIAREQFFLRDRKKISDRARLSSNRRDLTQKFR